MPDATIKAVAPWFGSNRMLAPAVGEELRGCKWVGIPFAGGMSELLHIKASSIVVGDLHRHVINLALCIKNPDARAILAESLDKQPFHPDVLESAQLACREIEKSSATTQRCEAESIGWAIQYFICCWMGRSTKAGTDDEFKGALPVRWSASGGDSNTRYRSAVKSLESWSDVMRRCNFVVQDVFEFLSHVKDQADCGVYLDPPFPGPGDKYRHKFTEAQHVQLAAKLAGFRSARIVCRFYDHELIRRLYPESQWTWRFLKGRTQANEEAPEVLILNGPSYAKE